MYIHGEGVTQDNIQAYAWLLRASEGAQGDTRKVFAKSRDDLAKSLTGEQIAEATRLAEKSRAKSN
jgi:TPR repeat protein